MPADFVVFAEASADALAVSGLADRVIRESGPDWITDDSEQLDFERRYRGLEADDGFTCWKHIPKLAREYGGGRGLKRLAWGKGKGREDYITTWKAVTLAILQRPNKPVDAIFLSRDTDGKQARWDSWNAIQKEVELEVLVVVAAQHPKLEAWQLNGFEPENLNEKSLIETERKKLGFDPRLHADKLTAEGRKGVRNAKLVVDSLCTSDADRKRSCTEETDLDLLEERGKKTGLTNFLVEVREKILPLFERH